MKYNSVENAERFITDQMTWCKQNGYKNFTIWSNGDDLVAKVDTKDIVNRMQDGELKSKGYWKAIQFENGYRVEI